MDGSMKMERLRLVYFGMSEFKAVEIGNECTYDYDLA